jgi:hypothetical protein
MIISKDRITREKLVALIQFSIAPECQFLTAIKPNTNIVNDHVFQNDSVLSFLKVEERTFKDIDDQGQETFWVGFSVKILAEDKYWNAKERPTYKSETVPPAVLNKVAEILNQ